MQKTIFKLSSRESSTVNMNIERVQNLNFMMNIYPLSQKKMCGYLFCGIVLVIDNCYKNWYLQVGAVQQKSKIQSIGF